MVCTKDISGIIEDLLELDVRWRDGAIVTSHLDKLLDPLALNIAVYQALGPFDKYISIIDLCEPDAEGLKELKDAEVTPKEFLEYIKKDFEENGAPDPEGMSEEEILMHILVESLPIDD
jgi:hypothetical protein